MNRSVILLLIAVLALAAAIALSFPAFEALDQSLRSLVLLRRGDDVGPQQFEVMRDITAIGSGAVVICVAVITVVLLWANERGRDALLFTIALILSALTNAGLKLLFAKARPPADESYVAVFTLSYPSGHTLMTGAVAGALALIATREGTPQRRVALICAVLVTFIVGVSRVRLGAHWPTDVMAGWLTALALNCALAVVLNAVRRAKTPPEQGQAPVRDQSRAIAAANLRSRSR